MLIRWFHRLTAILLTGILLFALALPQAAIAEAENEPIPSTVYQGAPVPDWGKISLSSLPVLQAGGSLQIPDSLTRQLGYNPSRIWQAGASIGDVLMLGDVQDAFQLQNFSLDTIAQMTRLNLGTLSLSDFPLIQRQTIASLVNAIPNLDNLRLNQVKPLEDLVTLNLHHLALKTLDLNAWGNQTLSAIASHEILGQFSLGDLSQTLNQYSFPQIPGLEQMPLGQPPRLANRFHQQHPRLSASANGKLPHHSLLWILGICGDCRYCLWADGTPIDLNPSLLSAAVIESGFIIPVLNQEAVPTWNSILLPL